MSGSHIEFHACNTPRAPKRVPHRSSRGHRWTPRPRQQRGLIGPRGRVRSRCRRHRRGPTRPRSHRSHRHHRRPGPVPNSSRRRSGPGPCLPPRRGFRPGGSRKPRRHRRRLTSPQSRRHPPGASPVGFASSSPFSCSSCWRLATLPSPRTLSAWSESASGLGSSRATRRNHQVSCRPAAPPRGINDTAWPGWHVSGPVRPTRAVRRVSPGTGGSAPGCTPITPASGKAAWHMYTRSRA